MRVKACSPSDRGETHGQETEADPTASAEGHRLLLDHTSVELQPEVEGRRAEQRREQGERLDELWMRATGRGLVGAGEVLRTLLRGPDRFGALITFWIYSWAVSSIYAAVFGLGSLVSGVNINPIIGGSPGDPVTIDDQVHALIIPLIGLLFSVMIQHAHVRLRRYVTLAYAIWALAFLIGYVLPAWLFDFGTLATVVSVMLCSALASAIVHRLYARGYFR